MRLSSVHCAANSVNKAQNVAEKKSRKFSPQESGTRLFLVRSEHVFDENKHPPLKQEGRQGEGEGDGEGRA